MCIIPVSTSFTFFKLCNPQKLREVLHKEISISHRYLTYPSSKRILHEEIDLIDIYGDNSKEKNVEHIFPQYMFKNHTNKLHMKSDLHHLYLCNSKLNSYRQNFKYMDSSNALSFDDVKILDTQGNIVTREKDIFAKKGYLMLSNKKRKTFIPSEYSRGKIARSLAYFSIRYNIHENLDSVIDIRTMLEWNLKDPVDNNEYLKNIIIYKHQGNLNPFIIDPDLLLYCFSDYTSIDEKLLEKQRKRAIDPLYSIEYLLKQVRSLEYENNKIHKIIKNLPIKKSG